MLLLCLPGGFKLKGVDKVIDVVSVMPTGLEGRLPHLPPPTCSKVSL